MEKGKVLEEKEKTQFVSILPVNRLILSRKKSGKRGEKLPGARDVAFLT